MWRSSASSSIISPSEVVGLAHLLVLRPGFDNDLDGWTDLADPDTLILFERWRDQAALDAHGKSAHMAEFQKVMAANPPTSRDLRVYETDEGNPLG